MAKPGVANEPTELPRSAPRLRQRARLLVAALALLGCTPPPDPVVLHPGDSWFDELPAVRLLSFPASNSPPEAQRLERLLARRFFIQPAEWKLVKPLGTEGWNLWRYRATERLDLGTGDVRILHAGGALVGGERDITGVSIGWKDPPGRHWFRWNEGRQELVEISRDRPGPVEVNFGLAPADLLLDFARLAARPPSGAADLTCDAELGTTRRRSLLAGAPSELALPIRALEVDELRFAAGLPAQGLDQRDGEIVRVPSRSDGVDFSVAVELDGRRETVWSGRVERPGDLVEARADLTRFRGRSLTLVLATEPGPTPVHDYALWSDLRFHGTPRHAPLQPHVVLLDVDLPANDLDGSASDGRIASWAARSATVYADALGASDDAVAATISLLTGLAAAQHRHADGSFALRKEHAPLAEQLRAAGYETWARTSPAGAEHGFALGFARCDAASGAGARDWSEDLARIRDRQSERPLFCFLQAAQAGGEVGAFLEGLDGAFGADPYLVVVTASHVSEPERLDVPLIVRFPGGRAERSKRPVSTLDVVPTILDLAGLAPAANLPGVSLRGTIPSPRLRVASRSASPDSFVADYDGWRLLTGGLDRRGKKAALFRTTDAGERSNVAAANPEPLKQLTALLAEFRERFAPLEGSGPGWQLPVQIRAALEHLGDEE